METSKVLDTNLLIDGESGLTTIFNVLKYPKSLERNLNDIIWPTRDDYTSAIDIIVLLLEIGKPLPAIDVLLAAMCINRKLTLVTRDPHFEYVKYGRKEFSLELKRPRSKK